MNLFVAKLSSTTTVENLQELFSAHGEVTSVKIIMDRDTGNSKGYGFVEMPNDDEAKAAIAALNDSEVDGKPIVVKESAPKEERPRRDSRGGGHNRGGGGGYNRGGGGGYNRGGGDGGRRDNNRRDNNRW